MKKAPNIPIVAVSLACYLLALMSEALLSTSDFEPEPKRWLGYQILAIGWLTVLQLHVSWFANPALLLSWVATLLNKRGLALPAALVAGVLSLNVFVFNWQGMLANEGGGCCLYIDLRLGAYAWFAAIGIQLLGVRYYWRRRVSPQSTVEGDAQTAKPEAPPRGAADDPR